MYFARLARVPARARMRAAVGFAGLGTTGNTGATASRDRVNRLLATMPAPTRTTTTAVVAAPTTSTPTAEVTGGRTTTTTTTTSAPTAEVTGGRTLVNPTTPIIGPTPSIAPEPVVQPTVTAYQPPVVRVAPSGEQAQATSDGPTPNFFYADGTYGENPAAGEGYYTESAGESWLFPMDDGGGGGSGPSTGMLPTAQQLYRAVAAPTAPRILGLPRPVALLAGAGVLGYLLLRMSKKRK